jgi:hypothetical protein
MARLCEREKALIRRTLGPGWLRRAEREMANEPHALDDVDVMIWEEDIARIRKNNRRSASTQQHPSDQKRGKG